LPRRHTYVTSFISGGPTPVLEFRIVAGVLVKAPCFKRGQILLRTFDRTADGSNSLGLASCVSAASSSRTTARSIHSIETTTRNFPLRRRTRPSRPAKGPDLIRTCLPALKNGYGSALHIANEDRSASISSSGRLAGLPLKLTNRITPGCAKTRTLFVINILTNTYPGNRGSSTSARRRFQRCTAR
jgi:hypothetical protein